MSGSRVAGPPATVSHHEGAAAVIRRSATFFATLLLLACDPGTNGDAERAAAVDPALTGPWLVVLGTGQDGGYPQAGTKPGEAWAPERRRYASSLALVDPVSGERWLFEATPDFREQLHILDRLAPSPDVPGVAGIFLTHAHVGHYTGLMHLGHEIIGAHGVAVYAMPRMRAFLSSQGPWDQLVRFGNIELRELSADSVVRLNDRLRVTPFLVPHRDEYSETVGFRIEGPSRTVVFLPDIDKWERWEESGTSIEAVVAAADVAYLDGTFYREGEVPGRAMSEIPHPFIEETMRRFASSAASERSKIRFIHLNRTNPVAFADAAERRAVEEAGFRVASMLEILPL
jgi:pyrroloquinoline quinone biosynthesis protein B